MLLFWLLLVLGRAHSCLIVDVLLLLLLAVVVDLQPRGGEKVQ